MSIDLFLDRQPYQPNVARREIFELGGLDRAKCFAHGVLCPLDLGEGEDSLARFGIESAPPRSAGDCNLGRPRSHMLAHPVHQSNPSKLASRQSKHKLLLFVDRRCKLVAVQ